MGTREAIRVRRWREAFARQSASDRDVYDALSHPGNSRVSPLPVCHRLHFLQMHLEKLAKAFLCQRSPADTEVARIQRTHNVISKTLPTLVKHYWSQFSNTKKPRPAELKRLRELCREIDLLAPALDKDQTRRDNCEYPWAAMQEQQSIVIAPCGHSFPVLARLYSHDASLLLKAASIACQDLQQSGPN